MYVVSNFLGKKVIGGALAGGGPLVGAPLAVLAGGPRKGVPCLRGWAAPRGEQPSLRCVATLLRRVYP